MVVRNQRFGPFSLFHLETDSPPVQLTKYLLFILFTPQWVHIYPLEWVIWLHFMLLHFLRWCRCETSILGHSVRFVLKTIPPSSNGQNIFCASYLHPNGSIFIHWNGLSDCISCFYIFLGDGCAKPAFWDIQSVSSWNQFPPHPMDKISFVHPICTSMGPYLSIGMDYLIAFHAFTFFFRWWWCETSVLRHSVRFILKSIPP